jgi:hypothetical protein
MSFQTFADAKLNDREICLGLGDSDALCRLAKERERL